MKKRRGIIVIAAAAALAAAAGALALGTRSNENSVRGPDVTTPTSASATPTTTTVRGSFVLRDIDTAENGCLGTGGYGDISAGTPVILTNEANVIIGSTTLGSGSPNTYETQCTYNFSIPNVPTEQSQYAIEVSQRGKIVSSRAELTSNSWTFSLTLG